MDGSCRDVQDDIALIAAAPRLTAPLLRRYHRGICEAGLEIGPTSLHSCHVTQWRLEHLRRDYGSGSVIFTIP